MHASVRLTTKSSQNVFSPQPLDVPHGLEDDDATFSAEILIRAHFDRLQGENLLQEMNNWNKNLRPNVRREVDKIIATASQNVQRMMPATTDAVVQPSASSPEPRSPSHFSSPSCDESDEERRPKLNKPKPTKSELHEKI